jgi:hypothetical protein
VPDDPDLRRFLESAVADDSARSRAGVGALRERRAEDATLVGVLSNLADRGDDVIVTAGGHGWRGRIALVGPGGVVMRSAAGSVRAVRTGAITAVRVASGARVDGDGPSSSRLSWPLLVASITEPGDDVQVTVTGESTFGRLRGLSRSIAAIDTVDGGAVYVVLDAVDAISVAGFD